MNVGRHGSKHNNKKNYSAEFPPRPDAEDLEMVERNHHLEPRGGGRGQEWLGVGALRGTAGSRLRAGVARAPRGPPGGLRSPRGGWG